MSINLEKNRDKIVAAWSDVIDDKTDTDWALYGYEGQTNDLKVVGTGDGGLDELAEDLNTSKIMYAFVRVADPKTSLTKFVLINWQGEGAPTVRKGTCANHIRDVQNILKGAHLTINARLEDEVETELILKKVSGVGSAYSFKDHKHTTDNAEAQKTPIGTVYSRVNPTKEINAMDRDNFWKKEEEEEKRRVELERERKKDELVKVEEERRAREQKEYAERERRNLENLSKSSELNSPVKSPIAPLSPTLTAEPVEVSRGITQAELMRQQRNQEAKELIGGRVGAAKAIFSQNSASGQMQTAVGRGSAPAKPARNSIAQRINTLNNQGQNNEMGSPSKIADAQHEVESPTVEHTSSPQHPLLIPVAVTSEIQNTENQIISGRNQVYTADESPHQQMVQQQQDDDGFEDQQNEEPQYSTIKRSPHTKSANSQAATPIEEVAVQTVIGSKNNIIDLHRNNEEQLINEDGLLMDDMMGDPGLRARALYDYQAADESEITFDPGDIITHIDQIDEGWWQGLAPDGTYGLFPANYVELFKD